METPFFLAPMAEISHRALRELIEDFGGCDGYFSEMISAAAFLAGGPLEKWYIDTGPKPEKLVFQLVGSDSEAISRAAALLDRQDCAGIDINMGCSAPLIRKTGAGAAWMASIDRAGELITLIRPQVKRRLSVKLRIGYKDDFDYLVQFCRRLEDAGTDLITLHPRLITEKFKRLARWEYVGMLRNELKIPVAGNGDIASPEDLTRRAAGPCDAVMVGRGAVKMPWIFAAARGDGKGDSRRNAKAQTQRKEEKIREEEFTTNHANQHEQKKEEEIKTSAFSATLRLCESSFFNSFLNIEATGIKFLDLLSRYQPPEFHVSRAKRFFGFFCDNLKWGTFLKNQINHENTLAGIEQVWSKYFIESEE